MKSHYDYLIVGAGLTGCVFAERISSQLNKSVLMVDIRDHIAGNIFDYYEDEILIGKYGPHWFHTNDANVFNYLSKFTSWRRHIHRARTCIDGKLLPFPINQTTINELYGLSLSSPDEMKAFFESKRNRSITTPKNAEEMVVSKIGIELYTKFYLNYTRKQWGIEPTDLAASVTGRIPIRHDDVDSYFDDTYQAMPALGYTEMAKNMLASKDITVMLSTDYKDLPSSITYDSMIYTGPIDYFFDYEFGELSYRSLQFTHETIDKEFYQGYQQINFPNEFDFTRVTEWKHATGQKHKNTVITREYPCDSSINNEKYYPIPTKRNSTLFERYALKAKSTTNVLFCGRLADYKYYNMDQVVARALKLFKDSVANVPSLISK